MGRKLRIGMLVALCAPFVTSCGAPPVSAPTTSVVPPPWVVLAGRNLDT